jgi:cytochrome P450
MVPAVNVESAPAYGRSRRTTSFVYAERARIPAVLQTKPPAAADSNLDALAKQMPDCNEFRNACQVCVRLADGKLGCSNIDVACLRREAPVHYCAESPYGPYWSVTRYNDIMTVELDHATYSSQLGGIQVEDQPAARKDRMPCVLLVDGRVADMKRGSFIRMDPPRHTVQRKTVAPVATPTNLASYEATIREGTRAVLDGLPRNETFDWVDKVSIELTTMMLATLFDFPWEERRMTSIESSDCAGLSWPARDAVVTIASRMRGGCGALRSSRSYRKQGMGNGRMAFRPLAQWA